jgi:hypothetical protein
MMRRKRRLLTVVTAVLVASSVAVPVSSEYPWKNGNSFEIYRVDGVERAFEAGSQINLEVIGRSLSSNVAIDPESGFHVQAAISHADLSRSVAGANAEWNEGLRGWTVELVTPAEPRENYRLQVHVYCAKDDSPCAETFGRAAQVTETFHFDVR